MYSFKPIDDDDKRLIVEMVDAVLKGTPAEVARVVMVIEHAADENPLPHILDYVEAQGCRVESVFTAARSNGHVQRELIIRHRSERRPWDGSVE